MEVLGEAQVNLPAVHLEGNRGLVVYVRLAAVCAKVVTENIASKPTNKVFFVILVEF